MKLSTIGSIVLTIICLPVVLFAQNAPCGSYHVNKQMVEQYPEKQAIADQLNREALEYTEAHYGERGGSVKIIPTVIHIIHNYGDENITKAQVLDAMQIVNEDFNAMNSDLSTIISQFQGIIGNVEIEFRLAQLDPSGNCTDGITRTVTPLTNDAGENVKGLISWNTSRYMNIWVVGDIASGAGGYAYLPGFAPTASQEGIVIQHTQFGGIGTSGGSNFSRRTFSHEIGHYLNLNHPWGHGNTPSLASSCNIDDNVADTPNTTGADQNCVLTQNSCGSLDNVQNIMDYSTCAKMFTQGQKARMQSALNSSAGSRNNLWTTNNLNLTGTANGFSNVCIPTIDFSLDNSFGCEGMEVEFEDNSWNANVDGSWVWSWAFEGGTPSTSSQQNPTVTYNTTGTYNVTLTITNSTGSDSETIQNAINVSPTVGGYSGSFLEGAEDSDFPENNDPNLDWTIDAGSSQTWRRTTTAAFTDDASVRINLRSVPSGILNHLISPPLDFSDVDESDAKMTFRMAHAPRTGSSSERLRVYVSKNCGVSWSLRYSKTGNALNTNGGNNVTSTFVPNQDDWRQETVTFSNMAGEERVLIRFEALSDQENYLYIDDINILFPLNTGNVEIVAAQGVKSAAVFPNPVIDVSYLEIGMNESVQATIELVNVVGQTISAKQFQLSNGQNRIAISEIAELKASGIYFLVIRIGTGVTTLKLVNG